jgi:hypothetical protein
MNALLFIATLMNWVILQPNAQFWSFWSDSKAEIGYYKGTQMRYGEMRPCKSFLIFVTEPFNGEKQVKADNAEANNKIYTAVMKLNHVKRFQTGIYTYSIMSSVFTPVTPCVVNNSTYNVGAPLKITFTGQEWCGMTFHQVNRQADKSMKSRSNSYFESEGDREETLKSDEATLFGDDAFIAVRELTRPLNIGAITFYPTLEHARISHKPLAPEQATIGKKDVNTRFRGTNMPAVEWTIAAQNGTWKFTVEKQYPRRILAFEYTEQGKVIEKAELQESTRLAYWKLNSLSDEHFLTELAKSAK